MKQLITILFALLLGAQLTNAQPLKKIESFRDKVLPQYGTYFNQAQLTESGQLKLSAASGYIQSAANDKKTIMQNIASAWRDSLVLVQYGTKHELWRWNGTTGDTRLIDTWDMALPAVANMPEAKPQKMIMHPWFCYVGGQVSFDSQKYVNISLNTRLGFFLLKDRWDFATSISAGRAGSAEATSTGWSNLGVMSRVHFPLKKYNISPNIGGELTLASFGDTQPAFTPSLVLGVSWFVGIGRVDIGIKIGDITSASGGYSMYPGLKNVK